MSHPVSTTRNKKTIVVDLLASQASLQIAQRPYLLTVAAELLATSEVTGTYTWLSGDIGRSIGNCDVIKTLETDTIIYAQHLKSDTYSRFVKNKRLEPSSFISIELQSDDGETYNILQIIVGHPIPKVPVIGQRSGKSNRYWENHAFLWEDWPVKNKSVTKVYPW